MVAGEAASSQASTPTRHHAALDSQSTTPKRLQKVIKGLDSKSSTPGRLHPLPASPELDAARRLQRFIRSRAARRALRLITSKETIDKLKAMFLDDRAIKAGAASNPMYATGMLSARNQLRMDYHVISTLSRSWDTVRTALGVPDADGLSFDQYREMSRKLYLALQA